MAIDRENVAGLVKKAKGALSRKDFSTYWNTVFGIAASLGGSDGSEDEEDDYIDLINRKLGGPGTEA